MALGGIRAAQKRRKRRLARRRRMMEMMAGEMPMEPMPFRPDRHGRFRGHRHHNHAGTQFHVRMKTDQVIGLLEDILAGLKSGTVAIEIDDDQITLKPAGKMDVRFQTHQTQDSETIALRLKWRRRFEGKSGANLKISSSEPSSEE